jgi:uncharacterized Zn-finger protein
VYDLTGVKFIQCAWINLHTRQMLLPLTGFLRPKLWTQQRRFLHNLASRLSVGRSMLGKFPCQQCGKLFNHAGNLVRHQKLCQVSNPMLWHCQFCTQTFNRSDNLRIHMREKHAIGEQLVCSKCCKKFRSKVSLASHARLCLGL